MADATITHLPTATALDVELVVDYEMTRETPTVVHRIIGRADPDVTIAPTRTREGTLHLIEHGDAPAAQLAAHLAQLGRYQLVVPDAPTAGMTFVVVGVASLRLDDPELSRRAWSLDVPVVEVAT